MNPTPTYIRLPPNGALPDIESFRWFRAAVVLDGEYSDDWQMDVSRWLVDSGCLYMMAWGPNCTTWDDSVDYAQILKHLPDEAPDNEFIMTTWHEDDSLEDVFWQMRSSAMDAWGRIENSLILHVGTCDREREFLALYDQAEDLAEREAKQIDGSRTNDSFLRMLFRF